MMRIAVMQPYFLPYIGYFQLVHAVDQFIFLDDVNFKKRGWINRNRILINKKSNYLTIPCNKISQRKKINEIEHDLSIKEKKKLLRKVKMSYSNAPYFKQVFRLFEEIISLETSYISEISKFSIKTVLEYLSLDVKILDSSVNFANKDLKGVNRILDICKKESAGTYINLPGGRSLYSKTDFKQRGTDLLFLDPHLAEYKQFSNDFVSGLSILDVMMFNSVEEIRSMLNQYTLS